MDRNHAIHLVGEERLQLGAGRGGMQNDPTHSLNVFAQGQAHLLYLIIEAVLAASIAVLSGHIEQGPLSAHVIAVVGLLIAVSGVEGGHVDVWNQQLALVDLG